MSRIPEQILQAGCSAYCAKFLNGRGALGEAIEDAYFAIHDHEDWVKSGPKAWDGEGFPPVGTDCEYRVGKGPWFECNIRYITKPYHDCPVEVVMFPPHLKGEQTGVIGDDEGEISFRPIRTPEQIAAEEREKVIAEMVYGGCGVDQSDGATTAFVICGLLYDAGYRKQEAP